MTTYGFHASHEQIDPRTLLDTIRAAGAAGFADGLCSDHLSPWSERQGESGFAWSWLGAALQATEMRLGVVTAPGQRYHPVVTAQAIATLELMFPGRFWAALGSGEAMNEHVTGERWPSKAERNARLLECVDVIRALLAGEEVSHRGSITVDRARVWSLPESPPPLLGAAVTEESAAWLASWADGFATISQPPEQLRRVIGAYRQAGGRGPVVVQAHVSLAPTREEALAIASEQWRTNVFAPPLCWDLETPAAFDAAAAFVTPEAVEAAVFVTDDPAELAAALAGMGEAGADRVYVHHVGTEQRPFLEAMGERVLPQLRGGAR